MNKKTIFIFLVVVVFLVMIFSLTGKGEKQASTDVADDTAYYVEANGNFFVKLAKLCDDGCNYVINLVLDGIESVFSSFIDN